MAKRVESIKRAMPDLPHPVTKVLDIDDIFDKTTNLPNDALLLEHFKQEGRVTVRAAIKLFNDVAAVLRKEPNVVEVPSPVTIVGDIHGQFFDLMKLFTVGGDPATTRYLFLGDYVDRGYFSLECVLYIWALKLRRPDGIYLLRGNHECRHLTEYFTFKKEMEYKCSSEAYDACMKCFDCLPLAAVMNNQFFCVHGGLSPELLTVADIQKLNRFVEPEESGAMCDLLWSDPHEHFDDNTGSISFLHNETRGCSFVYTHKAVCEFLDRNKFLSVIRAHEAQDAGYRMYKQNPKTGFPSVITLFSAPNYLDVYNNKAAVMIYADNAMNIKKFSHSQHPYWLPNFMDVFAWSLPFIGEKTTEMLDALMQVCSKEELDERGTDVDKLVDKMKQASSIVKAKRTSYSDLSASSRAALILNGAMSPTGESPTAPGMDLKEAVKTFEGVKALDKTNEERPTVTQVAKAKTFRKRQTLEDM